MPGAFPAGVPPASRAESGRNWLITNTWPVRRILYFYPATGVYFWFGGGGWHSGRHLPRTIVLHNRVNVRLNTRVPYERHQEIRARYPRHEPVR